jgi:hypothetical protein
MPKGSDVREAGHDVFEQPEAFGDQFRANKSIPSQIAAWSGKAHDQFITDRIGHAAHRDRDYAGCLLGSASWCRTHHNNNVNLEPNQISRQGLEPICIPISIAMLDRDVQTLGVTELPQPVVKSNSPWRISRARAQYADQREPSLLLGVNGARQHRKRAAEKPQYVSPPHAIASLLEGSLTKYPASAGPE